MKLNYRPADHLFTTEEAEVSFSASNDETGCGCLIIRDGRDPGMFLHLHMSAGALDDLIDEIARKRIKGKP